MAASSDCFIRIGTGAQTALITDMYIPTGAVEYFRVSGGENVAVIRNATDGFVTITEMG